MRNETSTKTFRLYSLRIWLITLIILLFGLISAVLFFDKIFSSFPSTTIQTISIIAILSFLTILIIYINIYFSILIQFKFNSTELFIVNVKTNEKRKFVKNEIKNFHLYYSKKGMLDILRININKNHSEYFWIGDVNPFQPSENYWESISFFENELLKELPMKDKFTKMDSIINFSATRFPYLLLLIFASFIIG